MPARTLKKSVKY